MRIFHFFSLFLVGTLLVSACKSKKKIIESQSSQIETPIEMKPATPVISSENSQDEIDKRVAEYMDKQLADLKRMLKSAEVIRIKEGIRISFDPGVHFNFDSDALTAVAKENTANLASVLNKYPYTHIEVEGHTDSLGKAHYNMRLSVRRANAFSDEVVQKGVNPNRITPKGYGSTRPRQSNRTPEGRKSNRRIDAVITTTSELLRRASEGSLKIGGSE